MSENKLYIKHLRLNRENSCKISERQVLCMIKSIKVMLLPNNVQNTKMFQYAGAARFAYNWALSREKENYESGRKFLE